MWREAQSLSSANYVTIDSVTVVNIQTDKLKLPPACVLLSHRLFLGGLGVTEQLLFARGVVYCDYNTISCILFFTESTIAVHLFC